MVFTKNELRFDESLPLKEDFDMSIQQMEKYRGVLRLNFAFVCADLGELSGGTSVRRSFEREKEQFFKFRKKWGSRIVTSAHKDKGHANNRMQGGFLGGYDFTHPELKVPIKGV